MKSMTGFGSARGGAGGWDLCMEVASVNSRRGLDVNIHFPRDLADMEAGCRQLAAAVIGRGKLTISLRAQSASNPTASRLIHMDVLERYQKETAAAARKWKLPPPGLDTLLRLPGVVGTNGGEVWDEPARAAVKKLLTTALDAFQKSREREGAALARDLRARLQSMTRAVGRIRKRAPLVARAQRKKMEERLAAAGVDTTLDPERLHREVVYLADRADISEELTRLDAHLEEASRLLACGEAVGRNLDFQIQEIGREINTTGNKAGDVEISREIVALKTELEKIREQVQNLE